MQILQTTEYYFKAIACSEKTEDYREISQYYIMKFRSLWADKSQWHEPRQVCFKVGYSKEAPSIVANVTLSEGEGVKKWGAEPGKKYFILHIHDLYIERDLKGSA